MQFTTRAEVESAIEHYLMRPSRITGEHLSPSYKKRVRLSFSDEIKDLVLGNLRGGDLMRAIDIELTKRKRTYSSVGLVVIAQVLYYYDYINEEEYKRWMREGTNRYKPRRPLSEKIMSKDQLKAYFDIFLTYPYEDFFASRLYVYSALLLITGARSGAIIPVKMTDFTLTETEMTLKIKRLKSGNHQYQVIHVPLDVPLPNGQKFGEALYRYLSVRPSSEYLLCDEDGAHKSGITMSMNHRMNRHGRNLGMDRLTPHMFRFTCASIISDHVGVRQAQQLLGHADLKTTLRYANVFYDNTSKVSIANGFNALAQSYA